MAMPKIIRLLAALALVGACARGRASSPNPYADPARDCASAEALLASGREPTPEMAPQLWRVRACPARAGELLASVLLDSRSVTDMERLERRTWLTQYVHDARILAAGLAVANDTSATVESRLAAFRVLLWSKAAGHWIPIARITEGPQCARPYCWSTYTGHFYGAGPIAGDTITWPVHGAPMPTSYVAQIDSVALLIELAPQTPHAVRDAARAVRRFPPDPELGGR